MAAKKDSVYITAELELAEAQLASMAQYLKDNPYDQIVDRTGLKRSAKGGSYEDVIQNAEAIQKNVRETLKEYLAITETVKRLRQADDVAKEKEAKGNVNVPFRMRNQKTKEEEQ